MNVTILHNHVGPNAGPEERDVLIQAHAVAKALSNRCHAIETLPCTLNLESLRMDLMRRRPDVVFNLVESLAGNDQLMATVPMLLEALSIPHTGCEASAI